MKEIYKVIMLFIVIGIMLIFIPSLDNSFVVSSKLYISEIMSNNTYTVTDNDLEYSDYIEIYNGYKYEINLDGYHLSDSEYETSKWTFPNITIEPNEYLIIYASGKDRCDLENKICHANFKLSSKGEVVTLSDYNNNIINKFRYDETSNDIAYGYINGRYHLLNKPSPNEKNTKEKMKYVKLSNKELYINEYITHNKGINYIDNNYYDWVELYNNSDKKINLFNLYLTDDLKKLNKYKLPDIIIDEKSYKLIYLGDISKIIDKNVIGSFSLSDDDKYIALTNGKKIIDKVEIVYLNDNVSYGKKDNKWYYFTSPTPGVKNDTLSHETLGGKQ